MENKADVGVIIPIHNGEAWIDECFQSVQTQTAVGRIQLEVSVFDDASNDRTSEKLQHWKTELGRANIRCIISTSESQRPRGVGFAKNRAVEQSTAQYLCFQDVDDVMLPDRVLQQYEAALAHADAIVGCGFRRTPANSTARFTRWANTLDHKQLYQQIYTSHGPTLIMPTWFLERSVFDRVGGFSEEGQGTPEDLLFFYKHLDLGGKLFRVPQCLLLYRYHQHATTFSIHEDTIWSIRVQRLQDQVLAHWPQFTIWNAGKQGRKLYRSLHRQYQHKVVALCDVDPNKIGSTYQHLPIMHFTQAKPPLVICVKLDLTGGGFEDNLRSLNLTEGTDYVHFS